MIQDIFPHKLNNQYDKDAAAAPDDHVMYFEHGKLLVRRTDGGTLMVPKVSELPSGRAFKYLLALDEDRFFYPEELDAVPDGFEFADIGTIRRTRHEPKSLVYAAITAKHLYDWYRDTRFCGRCGHGMEHSKTERAMICPDCGNTVYPRIMPAVIVGVINGDKILLTKYNRAGAQSNALIAGFTEIGETVEETAAREVMEEAGVKVKNIRYYKSQPWGIANDILMGFYCDLDGSDEIHMDRSELKYAEWVRREDIELQPDDFSLTNEMMMMFKRGLR